TPVLFYRWGGETPLKGIVRVVEPTGFRKISALGVEEQRVWVISDITSPPEEWTRLGDGYRVETSFVLWHGDDVLQVPASALFRDSGDWAVYRVVAGRARLTPVRSGRRNGLSAEVTDGLSEGDAVIIHPGDNVVDGVRVRSR
ncbi:MAG: efflux transporter periplasmic adaptor subunit, partial [Gammaproteobacteria bacterium]